MNIKINQSNNAFKTSSVTRSVYNNEANAINSFLELAHNYSLNGFVIDWCENTFQAVKGDIIIDFNIEGLSNEFVYFSQLFAEKYIK